MIVWTVETVNNRRALLIEMMRYQIETWPKWWQRRARRQAVKRFNARHAEYVELTELAERLRRMTELIG